MEVLSAMTSVIDGRIESALITARLQLANDLVDYTGQPIIVYCFELIEWVLTGKYKPAHAPSDQARTAVQKAVTIGLRVNFGSDNPATVSRDVLIRRDSL